MTKSIRFLFLLCLPLTISACGLKIAGVDVGKAFESTTNVLTSGSMSAEERTAYGVDMTAIILGAAGVHPNEELQAYVNRVGSWVAMHASLTVDGEKFTDWNFIVIDSEDFNAFAMPGGFVVISSGAVEMLSSEAELAAILAHEIIHIEQDHHVDAILSAQRTEGLTNLAFIANDVRQINRQQVDRDYLLRRVVSEEVAKIAHILYLDGLSREDELDADSKAVILMARAGYEPYAYISVLQKVESLEDDRKIILSSTHPDIEDRIAVAFDSISSIEPYLENTQSGQVRFAKLMK